MPLRSFPGLAWIRGSAGNGTLADGSCSNKAGLAARAAWGEHCERKFFCELGHQPAWRRAAILDQEDPDLAELIQRICGFDHMPPDRQARFRQHRFRWVPVRCLHSESITAFPEAYFSLHPHHPDREWWPLTDSTGCAFHSRPEVAFEKAFLEFMERQSLMYHWYTGHVRWEGQVAAPTWEARMMPEHDLWRIFSELGTVRWFNISLIEDLPVVLFLLDAQPPQSVQFSVAAAAGRHPAAALASAIRELWQGYCFMLSHQQDPDEVDRRGDRYIRHFARCNHTGCVERYPAWQCRGHTLWQPTASGLRARISIRDALKRSEASLGRLLVYEQLLPRGAKAGHYAKVFSTGGFPFMATDHLPGEIPLLRNRGIHFHRLSHREPLAFP